MRIDSLNENFKRGPGNTVFDKATGEARKHNGFPVGHVSVAFRRTAKDAKPATVVPFPGDPPSDLAERRAYAEAGNPGVRTYEHGNEMKLPVDAYAQGFEAGNMGIGIAACPYVAGWNRQQWQLGWRAADSRRNT